MDSPTVGSPMLNSLNLYHFVKYVGCHLCKLDKLFLYILVNNYL